uniref:Centromere protein R n=1 Tax=Pavo cristatus TaxID=9049 RepID=A0A8C9F9T5_PAVCR
MCCRRLTFYCYLCCFCPFLVNLLGDEANSESRLSRRGQPQTVKDAFAALQSNVRSSLVRILKARENLTSLQALEGSRELENIIGVSDSSCILSAEVQKTQALMSQAEELQLLKRNRGQLPARVHPEEPSVVIPSSH